MLGQLFERIARIGAAPDDDDEMRLHKSLLAINVFPFMLAGLVWSFMYYLFNEPLPALIPFSYGIISTLSIVYFARSHNFAFFRFSQLLLILLLPFLLMIALGGFIHASAVILWALIAPLGALLFGHPRHAWSWFIAFVILVVLSGFLEPFLRTGNNLPPTLVIILFVLNLLGVSAIAFTMIAYFVGQKNVFQQKSETLLLNILPREIAAILKDQSRTIADQYDEASVLFADMVGFTPLSAELPPVEVVELLNEAFSFFDSLLDTYGVEKIRTIGDSYMVASGLPKGRPDHATALVHMALEMRDFIAGHTFHNGRRVSFRIGINTGSMIAGVIGKRKFVYDVWGDAVNVASRMESHGMSGGIQITRTTYEMIKDEFICEPRGTVQVKGKGEMEVWLVISAKQKS